MTRARAEPRTTFSIVRKDRSRRLHISIAASAGNLKLQFEAFQAWVVQEGIDQLEPSALALACLIAFDALLLEADLAQAYSACSAPIRWRQRVRIDWANEVGHDARYLSSLTTIAAGKVTQWTSFEQARDNLLTRLPAALVVGTTAQARVQGLLEGAHAWLQQALGTMLLAHVRGDARLAALPRTALAREAGGQALQAAHDALLASHKQCEHTYARAFEAALLGQPPRLQGAAVFINKLLAALRPASRGSDVAKRAGVLQQLRTLGPNVDRVDEFCALVFAFALMLVESGTRGKSELAAATPAQYVGSFAREFGGLVGRRQLSALSAQEYADIYSALLPDGQPVPSYRAAALNAFHRFLRTWWRVPALPPKFVQAHIDRRVAANTVWLHESKLIEQWLCAAPPTRFNQQLHVAIDIAGDTMIRAAELRLLRLHNLKDEGAYFIIEIAREISDGSEKSPEGRRRGRITSPTGVARLRAWIKRRREAENANLGDYLFGDPGDPSRVANAGRMHFWLNRLLKAATGDEAVSLHTLRHARATQVLDATAASCGSSEIEQLDELASEAGHVGAHVTAVNYCHLFEQVLRTQTDAGLSARQIDYAAVSRWCGVSYDALRARVSRAGGRAACGEIKLWDALAERASALAVPPASQAVALAPAASPLVESEDSTPAYEHVLAALADCASGLSIEQVAARTDMRASQVRQAIEYVGRFADLHARPAGELPDALALGLRALRDASGGTLGVRPDFARARQQRWRLLSQAIATIGRPLLHDALDYWCRCVAGSYLAVRFGSGWVAFCQLLKKSAINRSLVAIGHSRPGKEGGASAADMASTGHNRRSQVSRAEVSVICAHAQAALREALGGSVRQIAHAPRAGRPPVWLIVGSSAQALDKHGAANSLAGLHCCLLAAGAWLALTENMTAPIAAEMPAQTAADTPAQMSAEMTAKEDVNE